MTTLYYATGACSLGPHIVLEWIGAPYKAVRVAFGSEELLALNPAGSVPILREDDGWLLTQALSILDYLAHKHPEAKLSGGDSLREQAEAHRWAAFVACELHTAFKPIFQTMRYTTDDSDAAKQALVSAAHAMVGKRLAFLDEHLQGREWILGARSVVDAHAFPMIRWAIDILPDGVTAYPNVQALHDRIAADPAVQKVLAQEAEG